MFGRKQRIIETQKALIDDLREEIEHKERLIKFQLDRMIKLQQEIDKLKYINKASNIDFPNSQKGGLNDSKGNNSNDIFKNFYI